LEPRDLHAIAIVGSRKCTIYGREQAERFGSGLAGVGVTVVSGGARGVDTHAHKGAMLPSDGRTIAVLGCGVDVAYPPENKKLLDDIASRGAVVSDFPLGTPPLSENFPQRNRIISGLSRGVLVIEADLRSGSLITARYAADDHNRPVFAIPGRIDNPLSAGPHKLIRDGAILVETLADVLDNLGPLPDHVQSSTSDHNPTLFDVDRGDEASIAASDTHTDRSTQMAEVTGLTQRQQNILSVIDDPIDADSIVERTGLDAGLILGELTMLSIRGAVQRSPDGKFSRRTR
jgi:DNA processing protein